MVIAYDTWKLKQVSYRMCCNGYFAWNSILIITSLSTIVQSTEQLSIGHFKLRICSSEKRKLPILMATEIFTNEKEEKPEILVTKHDKQEERRINISDEANAREEKSSEIPSLWKRLKLAVANTSKLNGAFSLIQSNSINLRNLVVAASTYGLERLLNAKAFHCPEKSYRQYGFAFLFAPAIILFCINLLVIGEIWKLSSRMFVKRYRRRGDCVARVLPSLLKACVGPAVWLIVAFLEEDFYVCANLGPLATSRKNETYEQQIIEYRSQSYVLAWLVLVCLVTLGTVMIVWRNCFLKDNLLMESKRILHWEFSFPSTSGLDTSSFGKFLVELPF